MTTPEYAIIPPIHGTVEVAIPGNPPTLLRVTGVDWSPTERVLRVAVAATEFSTENAPGLGLVDGLPLGAASMRHEAEPTVLWSPLHIELLLHYHFSAAPFKNAGLPIVIQYTATLQELGLIRVRLNTWETTELGEQMVKRICSTPVPATQEQPDPRGEPLYTKGQGDYEVRVYAEGKK